MISLILYLTRSLDYPDINIKDSTEINQSNEQSNLPGSDVARVHHDDLARAGTPLHDRAEWDVVRI